MKLQLHMLIPWLCAHCFFMEHCKSSRRYVFYSIHQICKVWPISNNKWRIYTVFCRHSVYNSELCILTATHCLSFRNLTNSTSPWVCFMCLRSLNAVCSGSTKRVMNPVKLAQVCFRALQELSHTTKLKCILLQ